MASLAIIGSGAWGSALAISLSEKFDTIYLIAQNEAEVKSVGNQHSALNTPFSNNITITADLSQVSAVKAVLIATPSYAFAEVLNKLSHYVTEQQSIAWATKGFDTPNACFLHETFENTLPNHAACVISGPTFAMEIAKKKPSAIVVASKDKTTREYWAAAIQTKTLRAYTNEDITGVEVGGSVKNILAIAAGIAYGLGFGANTQAAMITRGLAEMTRLGVALGAKKSTFQGLSGMGDLVLTCSEDLSRNRRFGKELAKNVTIEQALTNVGGTVEGYNTLQLILSMARAKDIELPICEQVFAVTEGSKSPTEAVTELMLRKPNQE
ncbi:MAG: NAD(P)-dependent glycerol-3-phosphate dehydrogenase [Gammaproteobacteria bacterium]|nr:NAD(P)-dependent glycerol-3-phosphate dehydrogenase [Gammaproteobacteria bacterium]